MRLKVAEKPPLLDIHSSIGVLLTKHEWHIAWIRSKLGSTSDNMPLLIDGLCCRNSVQLLILSNEATRNGDPFRGKAIEFCFPPVLRSNQMLIIIPLHGYFGYPQPCSSSRERKVYKLKPNVVSHCSGRCIWQDTVHRRSAPTLLLADHSEGAVARYWSKKTITRNSLHLALYPALSSETAK